jgi:hypothetical protein
MPRGGGNLLRHRFEILNRMRRTTPLREMGGPPAAPMEPLSIVDAAARRRKTPRGYSLTVLVPGTWAGLPHDGWSAVTDGKAIVALFKYPDDADSFVAG